MQSLKTSSPRARRTGLLILSLLLIAAGYATRRTLLMPAHAQGAAAVSTDAPVADFNGDGILDFAYNNLGEDGTVAVRLGNGDGTTRLGAKYVLGTNVSRVRKGDFNGDGKMDLAVSHRQPGSNGGVLTILVGRGDGTFTPRAAGSAGLFVVGDFNHDGKADLAYPGGTLLGRGDATFTLSPQSPFAFSVAYDIAAGDFDGDGQLDVALADKERGAILLFGKGDGTFGNQADYTAAVPVWHVTAADLDGDGKTDVVTGSRDASTVTVFYNQGGGRLGNRKDYRVPVIHYVDAVTASDLNGDGKLDLAILGGNGEQSQLALFPAQCGGRFSTPQLLEAWQTATLLAGDFDGNGKPDVVAPVGETETVTYIKTYLNPDIGPPAGVCPPNAGLTAVSFAEPVAVAAAPGTIALVTSDFNLDGKPDLAAVNLNAPAGVAILLGDGEGRFPAWLPATHIAVDRADHANVADLNADGKPDLLVVSDKSPDTLITPLLGKGDGTFTPGAVINVGRYDQTGPTYLTTGDFNTDGKLDLAVVISRDRVFFYPGNGDGTFGARREFEVGGPGTEPYNIVSADFNSDGKLDVLTANFQANTYTVLFGRGDGTFAPRETDPQGRPANQPTLGVGPRPMAVGDFNSDGKLDAAIANVGSSSVALLLNNGDGTFTARLQFPEYGTAIAEMVAGDFNKDGRLDLAFTGSNSITVMPGLGDGTFGQNYYADAGHNPLGLAAGDFNRDGRADIAVARLGLCTSACPSSVAVFLNTTSAANPTPSPTPTPKPSPTPTPTPVTYKITGRVRDAVGRGVRFADVTLAGAQTATKKTDVTGNFQFTGLPRGSYTVRVSGGGYNYSPASRAVADLNGDAVLNFTGLPAHQMVTVHSATYRTDEHAFESIATLFGTNLSTVTSAAASLPLPTEMGGNSVRVIDSQGVDRAAPLFFVSPTQVNYQIPVGTAAGVAYIYATSADGTTSGCNVLITQVAPGLFTTDSSGSGFAAANVQRVKAGGEQSFEPVMQFDPARNMVVPVAVDLGAEGEQVYLVLYGTGLRFRTGISNVKATVGSQAATLTYAGPQPQFVGVDQVNVLIPRALKGAGEVNVALTVDGKAVNVVKMKVKYRPNLACLDLGAVPQAAPY